MSKSAQVRVTIRFVEVDERGSVTDKGEKWGAAITTEWGTVEQVAQKACDLVYSRVSASLPEFIEGMQP